MENSVIMKKMYVNSNEMIENILLNLCLLILNLIERLNFK